MFLYVREKHRGMEETDRIPFRTPQGGGRGAIIRDPASDCLIDLNKTSKTFMFSNLESHQRLLRVTVLAVALHIEVIVGWSSYFKGNRKKYLSYKMEVPLPFTRVV